MEQSNKSELIFAYTCGVMGILTLVIGLNVIPKNAEGYAERTIDVAFIIVLFIVFWAAFAGTLIARAMFATKHEPKQHVSGPSYKTKIVDGLTVRDD